MARFTDKSEDGLDEAGWEREMARPIRGTTRTTEDAVMHTCHGRSSNDLRPVAGRADDCPSCREYMAAMARRPADWQDPDEGCLCGEDHSASTRYPPACPVHS